MATGRSEFLLRGGGRHGSVSSRVRSRPEEVIRIVMYGGQPARNKIYVAAVKTRQDRIWYGYMDRKILKKAGTVSGINNSNKVFSKIYTVVTFVTPCIGTSTTLKYTYLKELRIFMSLNFLKKNPGYFE